MKAQLTLFMLIGFLLLVSIATIVYFQTKPEQLQKTTISNTITNAVKNYVTNCLDISARNTLELFGKQGGAIYTDQQGPDSEEDSFELADGTRVIPLLETHPPFTLDYQDKKFFSNDPKETEKLWKSAEISIYPWITFPTNPFGGQSFVGNGLFGWNRMPSLENTTNSWEYRLKNKIQKTVVDCAKWTKFEQQGLTINSQQPKIEVIFGADSTDFALNWPITVTERATQGTSTIEEFIVTYPLQLRNIYDLVKELLDRDVMDTTFNPLNRAAQDALITLTRKKPKGDIISILHPPSKIGGTSYLFQYSRHNRAPALNYIDQTKIDSLVLCANSTIQFLGDKLILQGSPECPTISLTVPITAVDPDEDEIVFKANALSKDLSQPLQVQQQWIEQGACVVIIRITASDKYLEDFQDVMIWLRQKELCL